MGEKTSSQQPSRPVVAAFDFDVTMTTRDTFLPFLYRAFGRPRVWVALAGLAPEAVKVVLKRSDRDRFKEKIVRSLFTGQSVANLAEAGRQHAEEILGWVRPAALAGLQQHKSQGHRVVMVSASLALYLRPVAARLGFDDLLCTELSSANHLVFDGELAGKNCRGPEKVARLEQLLGSLQDLELHAYGDSAGDKEMLERADHPNFRVFEH